jgi:8-oxo-dGTP diphosphatase
MGGRMERYVAGFVFNPSRDKVILVRKNRPAWQKGFLNGVGGHIEPGEEPDAAIIREFEEETGVKIVDWRAYCEISGADWICYFYYAISDYACREYKTMTDEEIVTIPTDKLFEHQVIENLRWLIPMCLDRANKYCVATS